MCGIQWVSQSEVKRLVKERKQSSSAVNQVESGGILKITSQSLFNVHLGCTCRQILILCPCYVRLCGWLAGG